MRILDVVAAILLLSVSLFLMIAVSLVILITSGRPVFYVSRRIGKGGRPFRHVKFRTMARGPELGRVFFEQERITRCGRFLRALHLDELPELFLVFSGRLSLVGPRPLPARLLAGLETESRSAVAPGLTCLAQISLLRRGRLDKRLQIRLDNRYVARRSPAYNLRILCATLAALRRGKKPDFDPKATRDRRVFLKLT